MNKKIRMTGKENKVLQYREQSNKDHYLRIQSQQQGIQIDVKE